MAPIATSEQAPSITIAEKVFNPFYSPPSGDDGDDSYKYAHYKVGPNCSSSCLAYIDEKVFHSHLSLMFLENLFKSRRLWIVARSLTLPKQASLEQPRRSII